MLGEAVIYEGLVLIRPADEGDAPINFLTKPN